MKILVIQLSDAGDVLQSTLLLRCLKRNLPDAEVHVLVQQQHADIIATNPYIDHLQRLHFNLQTTLHELMPQNFDLVLDLQPSNESAPFVTQLQPPAPSQKQKGLKAFLAQLFNQTKVPQHKAERYLQKAATLGVVADGGGLDFFIPKKDVVPFTDIPASHHAGFIAIAISATPAMQWPLYLLQQLCSRIQHPIILLGSQKESLLAEEVGAIDNIKIYNACGKFSLYETADLVRKARLLISFQPYFIQLGAAFSKEMVMLAPSAKEDQPYYSTHFLKSRTTPPYDCIRLTKTLLLKDNIPASDEKTQSVMDQTAVQIVEKTVQRLKGKP
jgi:ADP-heptose:LPS heptosyltransferase